MFVVVEAFVNENVLSKKKIDQTRPKNFTIKSIFEQDSSEKHKKNMATKANKRCNLCVCVGVRVCLCTKSLEIKSQKITK